MNVAKQLAEGSEVALRLSQELNRSQAVPTTVLGDGAAGGRGCLHFLVAVEAFTHFVQLAILHNQQLAVVVKFYVVLS